MDWTWARTMPDSVRDAVTHIRSVAKAEGLDFFETIFEMVDYEKMNELAAYGGFPNRYPHWRWGMEYDQLRKSNEYGLSRIYEMVVNNNPAYAYLLEGNSLTQQKVIIAHVYGHVDFFKNNAWFSKTNRKMIDEMANHASRVRRHMERQGREKVEDFIDVCLSLDNLIDPFKDFIQRTEEIDPDEDFDVEQEVPKLRAKDYMDGYINPPEYIESQKQRLHEERERLKNVPPDPHRDVLMFLLKHAPLEKWEADILSIIREEAYYFAPQGQTKVLNEGWASFWHSKLAMKVLEPSEIVDYADMNSRVLASSPTKLNPYKLGVELLRDVEERWDKGKFGREWDDLESLEARENYDRNLGRGHKKLFEIRRVKNDVTFIDEFLTPEFVRDQQLYAFGYRDDPQGRSGTFIDTREFHEVKKRLLKSLTNLGQPMIYVMDANFANRGELLLKHQYEGDELKYDYARKVLESLARVWKRPVNLETLRDGSGVLMKFDGQNHTEQDSIVYEPV